MIYQNKSLRLKDYDYSLPGAYFITICVKEMKCVFGDIVDEKMILNEYGKIANECWLDIPNHFREIELDEYTIMPNHVHGIIKNYDNSAIEQKHIFKLNDRKYQKLPVIIGSFKSAVTKEINKIDVVKNFKWQTSYHDRIIRNDTELKKIQQYIIDNPKNWKDDIENVAFRKGLSEKEIKMILNQVYKNL